MSFSLKMEQSLAELGVTSDLLTDDEKIFIDEQGYLIIHDILSPDQIQAFRTRLDELMKIEGEDAGLIIGRKGETLRAMQFLIVLILKRQLNKSIRTRKRDFL